MSKHYTCIALLFVDRGIMPFGQRKRNLEKTRSRGRKSKSAEGKSTPEIISGTQVC